MRYSVIILFFGILSAQWTGGSANLIESGRKEIGLFSPIYVGLNNGKEPVSYTHLRAHET